MRRLVWGLLTIHLFSVGPAFSQAEGNGENLPRFRFNTSVDAVHLSVSVVTKKGKLVTDLEQSDFWVLENDVIQDITYFSRGTDAPVDVVMLVDASGSMDVSAKTLNARNSAIQLIRGLGEEDRVAVYAFDRDLYRLTDFTKSKEDAVAALTRIEPFGSTALYDAVVTLSDRVVDEGFGRRAIVVVTDGVDTSSDATVELAVEKAKGVDLLPWCITLDNSKGISRLRFWCKNSRVNGINDLPVFMHQGSDESNAGIAGSVHESFVELIGVRSREVVDVVELSHRGDAGTEHLLEREPRQAPESFGVELVRESIHRIAPRPERTAPVPERFRLAS